MEKAVIKKERILDAAEGLFAKKGFDGTSTREIAKEAGVNMAMLSYYFGSKQGVLEAVVLRRTDNTFQFLQELDANDVLSAIEKVDACVDWFVDRFFTNYMFNRLVNRQIMLRREEMESIAGFVNANFCKNLQEIRLIIQKGIDAGELVSSVDIELFTLGIMSTLGMVVNNPHLMASMFGVDFENEQDFYSNVEIRERVRIYLKSMSKQFLTPKQD